MTQEEKTLILGALFHDIGKFVQRCTDKSKSHSSKGTDLVAEFSNEFIKILGSEESFDNFKTVISTHHNPQNDFAKYCKVADHISASERVEKEENEEGGIDWTNNFLCSLFTKIKLNSTIDIQPRYFQHQQLTKKNYNALIPVYDQNDTKALNYKYKYDDLSEFKIQLKSILSFFQEEADFNTLINLLLILFEKWLWCVPDFTGSSQTDISLFNHLKDVAGLSHTIWKTQQEKPNDQTLNLVIGDIPGIQSYIFDIANKKSAKILRGRSIFVQVLARNFASKFLDSFGLTECNLVMLAGGKFYIIAPSNNSFKDNYRKAIADIEEYLAKTFYYDIGFIAGKETFNWEELKQRKFTFGEIIDKATEDLNRNKAHQFQNYFFDNEKVHQSNFILPTQYITPKDGDSNNIKCKVTEKPIRFGKEDDKTIPDIKPVERQVALEYKIGHKVREGTFFLELDKDKKLDITEVYDIYDAPAKSVEPKILMNPTLDELLEYQNKRKDLLRNTLFLEVANYVSSEEEEETKTNKIIEVAMDFEKMSKHNDGAEYLTLIKGDIDNLGLLMAYGLTRDKKEIKSDEEEKDLTAISRTTTLSNQLKYFFSFFLNGFLKEWEEGKILTEEENQRFNDKKSQEFKEYIKDRKVYTVFAGGDDLMLICPHSSSLKLLKTLNDVFTDFVCSNKEVHNSYSLTNFKHHTPIRIVADIAEENQKDSKKYFKSKKNIDELLNDPKCFYSENDKTGTLIFDTPVKNECLADIESEKNRLVKWVLDNNNPVTMGTIRSLLQIAEIIKAFKETNDTSKLIWHPMLTYQLNRNIRDKKGASEDVVKFFDDVLSIYKENEKANKIDKILYPVLCETIYNLRNK